MKWTRIWLRTEPSSFQIFIQKQYIGDLKLTASSAWLIFWTLSKSFDELLEVDEEFPEFSIASDKTAIVLELIIRIATQLWNTHLKSQGTLGDKQEHSPCPPLH